MSPLTLTASCIDPAGPDFPQADKSLEYLLFTRTGPVRGLRIQQRVEHHQGAPRLDTYADMYEFTAELPGHIRQVLLRNGAGVTHEDQGRYVVYVGRRRWLLNNTGESVRLVNAAGVVLSTWDIPARTCSALPAAPARVLVPATAAAAAFGPVR